MSKLIDTMKYIRVRNMESPRTGKPVANQYVITTPHGEIFQSYESIICIKDNDGNITLDEDNWAYSVTTCKYRSEFLGENTQATRKKIEAGLYATANLNR